MAIPSALLMFLAFGCNGSEGDSGVPADSGDCAPQSWYADSDDDGYGDLAQEVEACSAPSGHVADDTDCDDSDATVAPGLDEVPDDGIDQDCSGSDQVTCFQDLDADGAGSDVTVLADDGSCDAADGEADAGGDCADDDASVYPGADELPDDGVDQDCSGTDTITCYEDLDGDGHGSLVEILADDGACDADAGQSDSSDDCDDDQWMTYPGAPEHCDGVDSNCDSVEANVVTVDGSFSYETIQRGIDGSASGSVVLVCDGTYTENLVIPHTLTLTSANGAETTIIDGGDAGSTVTVDAPVSLVGFTIQGGSGTPNPYDSSQLLGGGVYAVADVGIEDCEVSNNAADYGAGLFADLGVLVEIVDSVFGGNAASSSGGGLYLQGAIVDATGVTITGNSAVGSGGGGVCLIDAYVTLTNGSVDNNLAEFGGGLYLSNSGLILDNTDVSLNDGNTLGGGLFLTSASEVTGGVVTANLSTWGAGLLIEEASPGTHTTLLSDMEITDNLADRTYSSGGGVYAGNALVSMTNVTLSGNYAQDEGGGVSVDESEVELDSCSLSSNEAVLYGGGAHVFTGSLTSIDTSWGVGPSDNVPDDVSVTGAVTYDDLGSGESFTCSDTSGICE